MGYVLKARQMRVNPTTGVRTLKFNREDSEVILDYLTENGKEPTEVIRGMHIDKHGRLSFRCGGGYAVVDKDLLGGTGDGLTANHFEEYTGHAIRY